MEEGIEPTIEFNPISSMVNAVELPKFPKVGGMIPLRLFPLRINEVKAVFWEPNNGICPTKLFPYRLRDARVETDAREAGIEPMMS